MIQPEYASEAWDGVFKFSPAWPMFSLLGSRSLPQSFDRVGAQDALAVHSRHTSVALGTFKFPGAVADLSYGLSVNILIVDDSRLLRLSSERTLARAGHHVISAEDGAEGLRLALEQKPDLVVLDMMLPKLSGPEVLRGIRQNPETANIPVLVLSGLPQCNEDKLISEGATAYFQKSDLLVERGPTLFVQTVERLLARQS